MSFATATPTPGPRENQELEPDLQKLRTQIEDAAHLVWVFPTYWASLPAIVRGVVDRLFLPGWAYRHEGKPLPVGLLKGRSARVIHTMDSPWFWYWLVHRGSIRSAFGTGTLRYVGISPVQFTTIYGVRRLTNEAKERWLQRLFNLGARDARVLAT